MRGWAGGLCICGHTCKQTQINMFGHATYLENIPQLGQYVPLPRRQLICPQTKPTVCTDHLHGLPVLDDRYWMTTRDMSYVEFHFVHMSRSSSLSSRIFRQAGNNFVVECMILKVILRTCGLGVSPDSL